MNRGFGDLPSGVRELRHLQKLLPNAEFFFVFEHYATDEQVFLTLKKLLNVPASKTTSFLAVKMIRSLHSIHNSYTGSIKMLRSSTCSTVLT